MIIYKLLYKNYKLKQGERIGALLERRMDLRRKKRVESGLKWAKSVFGQMVRDKQAIFVIPHELTLKDNTIVPVEKKVFTREEFFGTMRGLGQELKRKGGGVQGLIQKGKNRTHEKERGVNKMKKILPYLFVIVILGGCFPATGHWIKKPGQASDEYWDREDCNRCALEHIWRVDMGIREAGLVDYLLWFKLVGKRVAVSEGFGDDIKRFYFNKCMEAKGYKWEVDEGGEGKSNH